MRELDHLITVDKIEKEGDEGWEECINKETSFDTVALGDPNLAKLKEGTNPGGDTLRAWSVLSGLLDSNLFVVLHTKYPVQVTYSSLRDAATFESIKRNPLIYYSSKSR